MTRLNIIGLSKKKQKNLFELLGSCLVHTLGELADHLCVGPEFWRPPKRSNIYSILGAYTMENRFSDIRMRPETDY